MPQRLFRILSLDGGGIRGIISATILEYIEAEINAQQQAIAPGSPYIPLYKYFDLITGTSTGSILAAGIAATQKSPRELVELYINNGKKIFPYWGKLGYLAPQRVNLLFRYGPSSPKFSNQGLIQVLRDSLGEVLLEETFLEGETTRLLIPAYDTNAREPIIFKNWRKKYPKLKLWEACTASASAPTFFPAYIFENGRKVISAIDGGIAANNPSSCAISEAIRLGYSPSEISLLSIGTGEQNVPLGDAQSWGVLQWAGHLVDVFMDGPLDIYEYISRQIVRYNEAKENQYLRLQPDLDNNFKVLSKKQLETLSSMDNASEENIKNLITFAQAYLESGTVKHISWNEMTTIKSVKEEVQAFVSANLASVTI
ncbi:MAG: patatin-like phospholipase family protein [Jaaginema sp. PMC 1079.18]|nr:patatin-like phospholipase family protein [Jaaginema sp. PMC 1080.18]MEC4851408.1 patatin-like phospholipase family protein [Jaaginema sp. PMC 1079.18]MEC4866186.1 patatin-like phospholipase family protein [Jaaginema sp. PMC 1078.18]